MRFILSSLVLLSSAAALAAQPPVQSKSGDLAVVSGDNGPRVRDALGHSNPLNIPEDIRLSSLAELPGGWLAAGVQPVGDRTDLYLRMLDPGGLKQLPVPGRQAFAVRHRPVLLASEDGLESILWLEGEDRQSLSVRASRWLGITWSSPEIVSSAGPGSQLALDAIALDDGSTLAVWSAYDGEDDEIMYSVGVDDTWTPPQALTDNLVPDILPTLASIDGGAVLAWNQYDDGQYRVVAARLVEGRWQAPSREAQGTLYPRLYEHSQGATMVFYRVVDSRSEWRIHAMDEGGTLLRESTVVARDATHPVVRRDQDSVILEWPDSGAVEKVTWKPSE